MQFDINVEHLEAGHTIEQSTCERVIGFRRDANQYGYQFALLQLGDFIQRSLWKSGKCFTVRTSNGEVQILTHEEASKYNESRFDLAIDKMRRCNRRLTAVDVGQLSPEARSDHGSAIIRQSRMLQLLGTVKRDIGLEAVTDKKPPLVIVGRERK
jgi:hypothetical protein